MKTAYIFPGQGSQAVGMGKDLFDNFGAAREVFEQADDALGFSLSEMCFSGEESDLQLTANTQPAILTTSVAVYRSMVSEGFAEPAYVAGHSLGEYTALVAAGVLDFAGRGPHGSKAWLIHAGSGARWRRSDGCDTRGRSRTLSRTHVTRRHKARSAARLISTRRRKVVIAGIQMRLIELVNY
jgi:hypothetical protein